MNLKQLLVRIKNMKDRDALSSIIGAAEARDSILSNIEGKRTRSAMWEKVMKLGIARGDTVYIHAKPVGLSRDENAGFSSKKHRALFGVALTVKGVKTRSKEIVVRAHEKPFMGTGGDHTLSPFECASLKLSKEPTPEALSNALQERITYRIQPPFYARKL